MHLLSFICTNERPMINNMFTIWIRWVLRCKRIIWCWRWSISNRGNGNSLPYKGQIWLVLSCRKYVWCQRNDMNHWLWDWYVNGRGGRVDGNWSSQTNTTSSTTIKCSVTTTSTSVYHLHVWFCYTRCLSESTSISSPPPSTSARYSLMTLGLTSNTS